MSIINFIYSDILFGCNLRLKLASLETQASICFYSMQSFIGNSAVKG